MQCSKPTNPGVPSVGGKGPGIPFSAMCEKPVPNPASKPRLQRSMLYCTLRHQLDDATGRLDLLLRQLADPSRAHDQGDFGEAALAEDLGVAEGQEVEDRDGVLLGAGDVGLAGLNGDQSPQLMSSQQMFSIGSCR